MGVRVEVGGGDERGAAGAASRLIASGARSLLSFGLAGGLEPSLRAGALIVPDVVMSRNGHFPTHPPLAATLGRVSGAVFSGGSAVATAGSKRALFDQTGAACIDLESAAVAEAAARHALPFAVLRAICDPAERSLPQAALVALDGAGRVGIWRVVRVAVGRPRELPALFSLATDAAIARRALSRRVTALRRIATASPTPVADF